MNLLIAIIALLPPLLIGRLVVGAIENSHPVLLRGERWATGFLLGQTLCMFTVFLLHDRFGLPLSLGGFLFGYAFLLIAILYVYAARKLPLRFGPVRTVTAKMTSAQVVALFALGAWTVLKISAGFFLLTQTPAYHDDVINNWNYRGKAFFVQQGISLDLPLINNGISSYPPTVPLLKTWTATLIGAWDHGAVNAMHMTWFIAGIVLFFAALRRETGRFGATLGALMFAGLPLPLMQSTVAYADIYVALHIFIAFHMLFRCLQEPKEPEQRRLLALACFAIAMLAFTKNEALVLYVPGLLLVMAYVIRRRFDRRLHLRLSIGSAMLILATVGPWLLFKWQHHLPFGNAKSVGSLSIGWQQGVLHAAFVNTFFEANWHLLFPLFFGLLLWRSKSAFRDPLLPLTLFPLVLIVGQLCLYLFTSISVEALQQTGYARGMLHLVPSVALLTAILLIKNIGKNADESSE